jgi:hypothetical protein
MSCRHDKTSSYIDIVKFCAWRSRTFTVVEATVKTLEATVTRSVTFTFSISSRGLVDIANAGNDSVTFSSVHVKSNPSDGVLRPLKYL